MPIADVPPVRPLKRTPRSPGVWLIAAVLGVLAMAAVHAWLTRPILIGALVAVDNPLGNEANLALRWLQTDPPRVGLRPVRFLIRNPMEDGPEHDEDAIVSAFRELEAAGVSAILGGATSRTGLVLAREAARSGVPSFGITASTGSLSGRKDGFYRLAMATDRVGAFVARHLAARGFVRPAIVRSATNPAYSADLAHDVAGRAKAAAPILVYEPGPAFVERLKRTGADALFLVLPPQELIPLMRDLGHWPERPPVTSSEWGFALLPFISGDFLDGVEFVSQNGRPTPDYAARIEAFRQRYGQDTFYSIEYTLSLVDIVVAAMAAVGTDRVALNRYFSTPRTYDYVYGRVHMDAYGDAIHDAFTVWTVSDGVPTMTGARANADFPADGRPPGAPGGLPRDLHG